MVLLCINKQRTVSTCPLTRLHGLYRRPLDDADVAQYLDIPSLSEQSEDITTLSTRNSNPTLQTAPAEINLRSPRHRNRNSDSSSFETRSFSAGWSTAASSPLSESGHQAYAMSRGARLLARDDRRLGRRSEEGDFPRRFFIEVDTSSATMGQAI